MDEDGHSGSQLLPVNMHLLHRRARLLFFIMQEPKNLKLKKITATLPNLLRGP